MKHLYFLLACLAFSSHAQQFKVQTDSILIFKSMPSSNDGAMATKGYVSNVAITESNDVQISVFKHHAGFLNYPKKPKNLAKGFNFVPGLSQYAFQNNKLSLQKEKIFSLSRNIVPSIDYTMMLMKDTLSTNEKGGDFAKLLKLDPAAVNFKGMQYNTHIFSSGDKDITIKNLGYRFQPYVGTYMLEENLIKIKKVANSGYEKPLVFWKEKASSTQFFIAKTLKTASLGIYKIDTTGKATFVKDLELKKTMIASAPVIGQNKEGFQNIKNFAHNVGVIALFANCDKYNQKCNSFTALKINDQGTVLFSHNFELADPEKVYAGAAIVANERDAIAKITLRKGLRFSPNYIKMTDQKVVYNVVSTDENAKTIATDKQKWPINDINHEPTLLFSTPDGNNLIGGTYLDAKSKARSYLFRELDQTGNTTRYFHCVNGNISAEIENESSIMHFASLSDGRIVILSDESFRPVNVPLKKMSVLNRYFSDTYNMTLTQNKDTTFTVGLRPSAMPKKEGGILGTGFSILSGKDLMNNEDQVEQVAFESRMAEYAHERYVIDPAKGTTRSFSFRNYGSSLPDMNGLFLNTNTNEVTNCLISTESEKAKRNSSPPQGYLKVVKVGL